MPDFHDGKLQVWKEILHCYYYNNCNGREEAFTFFDVFSIQLYNIRRRQDDGGSMRRDGQTAGMDFALILFFNPKSECQAAVRRRGGILTADEHEHEDNDVARNCGAAGSDLCCRAGEECPSAVGGGH
jgi:hypothetical protein